MFEPTMLSGSVNATENENEDIKPIGIAGVKRTITVDLRAVQVEQQSPIEENATSIIVLHMVATVIKASRHGGMRILLFSIYFPGFYDLQYIASLLTLFLSRIDFVLGSFCILSLFVKITPFFAKASFVT